MSVYQAKKFGYLAAGAAFLALVVAQGCGDDTADQATPSGGSAGASHAGAGGKTSGGGAGGKTSGGGSGNVGGEAPTEGGAAGDMGMGGEAGASPVNCDGPAGCYSCTPKTNDQFLNHCVEGGCPATFNNATLTKINLVGTL